MLAGARAPHREPGGKLPHGDGGDSICLCNTMFLFSRAGQGTWDLLATKE